jgi:site-specific recombinase XerD
MKEKIIRDVLHGMGGTLDSRQLGILKAVMANCLKGLEITEADDGGEKSDKQDNEFYLDSFIAAKKVEGCSGKTLDYYKTTIKKLIDTSNKAIADMTTDDLRAYLSRHQEQHKSGKVTMDNVRRILSSFFSWLEDEDYIVKSPVRRIHKVKTARLIKETLTDENLEVLRDTCDCLRNLAIIELLASSGMRVGELVRLNREDMNLNERACVVFGKGDSQREVYFDARTKLHLKQYLAARNDDNKALFVSISAPHNRLGICGVEKAVKKLGNLAEVAKVHPHKFRRTLATMAIDKGMPIEQVQTLLGHVKIETTMHYAKVNQKNVKISHRKYLG